MNLELTQKELSNFLEQQLQVNTKLIEMGETPITFNVSGEKGIGKTQIIKGICNKLGYQFVKLNLNGLEELGSLIGFPVEEHLVETTTGEQKWVPKNILDTAIKAGAKYLYQAKMSTAPPEYIADMKEGPGVLLLDDYTRALPFFMQATMQLTEEGGYHAWSLPKGWMVILSTNPEGGEYNVASLDSAQRTRFININMRFEVDSWLNWAEQKGIDYRCLAFVQHHAELFSNRNSKETGIQTDDTLCARTMEMYFKSVTPYENWQDRLDILKILGNGSVGSSFTNHFVSFINDKFDKLPSPEAVIKTMKLEEVLAKFDEVIKSSSHGSFRRPVASLMLNRMVTYILYTTQTITQKEVERLRDLILSPYFTADMQHYAVRRVSADEATKAGRSQVCSSIITDPRIQALIRQK